MSDDNDNDDDEDCASRVMLLPALCIISSTDVQSLSHVTSRPTNDVFSVA